MGWGGKGKVLALFQNHHFPPSPQLVFNFLLNKMLKISTWEPSKCFAIMITLFNLVEKKKKKVNLLLERSTFLSHPPQNKMYSYHPPNDTICSQTSVFLQKLLDFFQQTPLQQNKELQLIEPGFAGEAICTNAQRKNNQEFKGKTAPWAHCF